MSNAKFKISASDQTKAAFKSVESNLKSVSSRVLSLKTAIAGAVGVGGVGLLIHSQMQAADATAKFGDAIGITTGDLTRLQYAAKETAGVTDQAFNLALRRMTRRIAEAADGTGPAVAAIKDLGLSAQALKAAGPDEAFKQIADAMQGVEDQGDKLRIAFKLFDTDGGALVNTLKEGRSGLEAWGQAADQAGYSISRIDAAKIEAANDAISGLQTVGQSLGRSLAVELAPTITAVANHLRDSFTTAGAGAGDGIKLAVDTGTNALAVLLERSGDVVGFLGDNMTAAQYGVIGWVLLGPKGAVLGGAIGAAFDIVDARMKDLGFGIAESEHTARRLANVQERIARQQEVVNKATETRNQLLAQGLEAQVKEFDRNIYGGMVDRLRQLQQQAAELQAEMAGSEETQQAYAALMQGGATTADRFKSSVYGLAEALRQSRAEAAQGLELPEIATPTIAFDGIERLTEKQRDELQKQLAQVEQHLMSVEQREIAAYDNRLKILDDAMLKGLISLERWGELEIQLSEQLEAKLKEIREKRTDEELAALRQIEMAIQGFGRTTEDALIDAAKGGKDAFSNMTKAILEDIARLVLRMQVIQPLVNQFGGAIGGFFGGGATTTASVQHSGGMAGSGPTRQVPAALFTGAPRYHRGGMVGLAPDEVPAILQRGERVLSRKEVAQGNEVKIIIQNIDQGGSAKIESEQSRGPNGEIIIRNMIRAEMQAAIGSGAMDRTMANAYGLRRRGQ